MDKEIQLNWPYNWNKWFAWYPVVMSYRFENNKLVQRKVWWKTIERRRVGGYAVDDWEYRDTAN